MNELPWFLHCIQYPPTDPLTRELLALVDGLPPVPGPKTIGPENYSRVSEAFLSRGWAGFEEAFDAVVSRDRADYAAIKRELLRESIFSPKVHLRMARMSLGESTIDEIMDEIARDRVPHKPQ